MRQLLLLGCILSLTLVTTGQKNSKTTPTLPKPTTAAERWDGYQKRQQLIANSLVKNVSFRNIGPTIMSGRVVDIAVDPNDPTHFYVAYASGGLWETTTNGISFEPLFDNEIVMTIGDIEVDWTNNVLYVGSGENNSSRSSYSGYGMFKSSDNGKSWTELGLNDTHHIGRIVLHPNDANTMWVAALGHLYSENEERGIYKTTDGGKTWKKTLYVNSKSGIIELAMHPANPNILLAAAWEKDRKAWNFQESGNGSGIYQSIDGGNTWSLAMNGFPDTEGTGRIGLSFAPSDPTLVYAILDNQDRREEEDKKEEGLTKGQMKAMSNVDFMNLENKAINQFLDDNGFPAKYNAVDLKADFTAGKGKPSDLAIYLEDANSLLFDTPVKGGEIYRSNDSGKTWTKTHEGYIEDLVYSYGYYFGQIRVDGIDPNRLYTFGVPVVESEDGGKTWASINQENVHSDHHALWINPTRKGHLILGNDGGINISYDDGKTWIKCNSPAVGQFYAINVDMAEPYNVYGGLQDNGVWKGPSTYKYDRAWYDDGKYPYESLIGGDGMQVAVDTRDNSTVYTGYQFGNYFRVNTKTGDRKYITPKHELGESPFRWNWQAPILVSVHNQDIVYFGSNRFHRSMNNGDDFMTLSGDLTKGGKKGDVSYGTLTSISESPKQFGLLYAGSDDGLVHVSKDAGQTWKNVTGTLPSDFWVSRVVASSHKLSRVYLSLNGYRWDNFDAMAYVSEDFGTTWKQIGLNLPKEPVNVIKEDPVNENILYVGTDHGVYVSLDRGQTFMAFTSGLPAVAVHDLLIHPRENDLVVGTHGRSIYVANMKEVQKLPGIEQTGDFGTVGYVLFDVDDVTFSERWGSKGWTWAESFNEPKMELAVYSASNKKANLVVKNKEEEVLYQMEVELIRGLNYLTYNLETTQQTDESGLSQEALEKLGKKDNGKFYLPVGDYTIGLLENGTGAPKAFKVKEPKKRNARKE